MHEETLEHTMIPIKVILDELKGTPSSIVPILQQLLVTKCADLAPDETRHLVARTLNLTRLAEAYNRWCGTVLIKVLALNYELLASDGIALLDQLVKNLDSWSPNHDKKVLLATIDTIDFFCYQIRGKDTLVREILTPKLSGKGGASILGGLLEHLESAPVPIIRTLHTLLTHHPTVFRSFGTKYEQSLLRMVALEEFTGFSEQLKQNIFAGLAALPAIEKSEPELQWEQRVGHVVSELQEVLAVYLEFLKLEEPEIKLLDSLKSTEAFTKVFPDMVIDFNKPALVLQIGIRVETLVRLIGAYLCLGIRTAVKVPLGVVLAALEAILLINPRFQKFRPDVVDPVIQQLVGVTIHSNHAAAVALLQQMVPVYNGALAPHFLRVVATLETVVAISNLQVDQGATLAQQYFYAAVLDCIVAYLKVSGSVTDALPLLRFIDVANALVLPRVNTTLVEKAAATKKQQQNPPGHKKNKKRKNAVPLADLLSNQHLFTEEVPKRVIALVRKFFSAIITRVAALPLTYHYKIMRYIILESVTAQYYSADCRPPLELRELLVNAVVYPGYEKTLILPMVALIIGDDPVISVFCNPRLPPLPRRVQIMADESEEEEEHTEGHVRNEITKRSAEPVTEAPKRRRVEKVVHETPVNPEVVAAVANEAQVGYIGETIAEKMAQAVEVVTEKVESVVDKIESGVEVVEAAVESTVEAPVAAGDDSDFEMPALDAGDSDDDDE